MLERLWQLYRHDLSELRGSLPESDGSFPPRRLALFLDEHPDRRAYLIRRDGRPLGFALISGVEATPLTMVEFFVVRAVRRQGVAREAVRRLFELHPGSWAIAFQDANVGAARLWRGLAEEHASGHWREERRPVPGKPELPPDVWLLFDL